MKSSRKAANKKIDQLLRLKFEHFVFLATIYFFCALCRRYDKFPFFVASSYPSPKAKEAWREICRTLYFRCKLIFYFCVSKNLTQKMLTLKPKETPTSVLHSYLLGAIAPRPIAFVSTVNKDGVSNLSPFSFFNIFSVNPPIVIFSPARRGKENTTKHTYENIKVVGEAVINVVNYDMVQQTSLSSTEYPEGVDEFIKAGFTPLASELVKPFRVKESPVQMECKVREVVELGTQGGAGNLVICEILLVHINKNVLNSDNAIDPHKIDLVSRLGGNWYCRASGDALFEVEKPLSSLGIGVDTIPLYIRNSKVLTGNNLGQLGNVATLPSVEEVEKYKETILKGLFEKYKNNQQELTHQLHIEAKQLLDEGKVMEGWKTLLSANDKEIPFS